MKRITLLLTLVFMACVTSFGQTLQNRKQEVMNKMLTQKSTPSQSILSSKNDIFRRYPALKKQQVLGSLKSPFTIIGNNMNFHPSNVPPKHSKPIKVIGDGTTIWGNVIYRNAWASSTLEYGIYSFPASDGITFSSVALNNAFNVNGGGAFYNDKFHFVNYYEYYGYLVGTYYEYNTDTWEPTTNSGKSADIDKISLCQTFDPTTDKVYGMFYNISGTKLEFAYIDYEDYYRSTICSTDSSYMTMSANKQGEIYAISSNGYLVKLDKTTGAAKVVGFTGVIPGQYVQSATFDMKTNKMYWASLDANKTSVLYEVNVSTGLATKISDFPDGEEITCLYIPTIPNDGAPAKADNFKVNFVKGDTTGVASFRMPTKTYSGNTLTGDVEYTITSNHKEIAKGKASAGDSVSANVTVRRGNNKFVLVLKNDNGESEEMKVNKYVGYDYPIAVSNLNLSIDTATNVATVTWKTPARGYYGGFIDKDNMIYKVTRYTTGYASADTIIVASGTKDTIFSETLPKRGYSSYYYSIVPYNHGVSGLHSNSNNLCFGDPINTPYIENFDGSGFNLYTVIDANNDYVTWTENKSYWDGTGSVNYSSSYLDADDWLITPPISLKNDRQYVFAFRTNAASSYYAEKLSVAMGTSLDPTTFAELMPATDISNTALAEYSRTITAKESGAYRFAFHILSPADQTGLNLDSIVVREGAKFAAPDSATLLTITPALKGVLKATLSFTAPTKTVDGKDLTSISKIEIKRGDEIIKTINNAKPGQQYTVEDINAVNGYNTYTVVAWNVDGGKGIDRMKTVYVGMDIPLPPHNIILTNNNDGTALMAWKNPGDTGKRGGYVNSKDVIYDIYSVDQNNELNIYADSITGNDYHFTNIAVTGDQNVLQYVMTAKNIAGTSDYAVSSPILSGAPYTLPFQEGFSGNTTYKWLVNYTGSNGFETKTGTSADNDNSYTVFSPSNSGESSSLSTGKIKLKGGNPKLVYSYFAYPGHDNQLTVAVEKDGKDTVVMKKINYIELKGKDGWRRDIIDLSSVQDASIIRILFIATVDDTNAPIALDDINVRNVLDNDLSLYSISVPNFVTLGTDASVTAVVKNYGVKKVDDYTVKLMDGDKELASVKGDTLSSFDSYNANLKFHVPVTCTDNLNVKAVIEYYDDLDNSNDSSENVTIPIKESNLIKISDLSAESNGSDINLKWTAPTEVNKSVTEDFESYDAWSINNLGNWTLVDADGTATYGTHGISFPHEYEPYAYIVFKPSEVIDVNANPKYAAHSGSQHLISFATQTGSNDDWLISPTLSKSAQTISLYARSWAETFAEQFEICYSTTGKDVSDFKVLSKITNVPSDWTEYTAELPEGTKYFAIHYNATNLFAICLDDIKFEAGSDKVLGFNIYRNGEELAHVDASTTAFVDNTAELNKNYNYNVTVVYDSGESGLSNTASACVTAINTTNSNRLYVSEANKHINIYNADGKTVSILSVDGKYIFNGKGRETMTIPVQSGLYMVKIDKDVFRVSVK